jgi:hypothetical protein
MKIITLIWTGLALVIINIFTYILDPFNKARRAETNELNARWLKKIREVGQ